MKPRLTIGIPTYNRPLMLPRAVGSALAQVDIKGDPFPVRVLVADDGDNPDATERIVEAQRREGMPHRLDYIHTGANCLWANWDAAARACDTEFFLWLQDDDVIRPCVAERVCAAFDRFPDADVWLARNQLSMDERFGWWNGGNGPWVPLDFVGAAIDQWEGEIFAPTSYFLSWSLSPAVAFRRGARFTAALDAMPMDCDLFAERLILVGMGKGGRFVADPIIAGLWIQHQSNMSRAQHDDQPRQSRVAREYLDRAMDDLGAGWEETLAQWGRLQIPHWVLSWIGDIGHFEAEGGKSRHGDAIRRALWRSLDGRIAKVPRYRWWRRAYEAIRRRAAL